MFNTKTALAAGLIVGFTSLSVAAGELSFESRGYGGPLYIGPNFQQGGQHSAPVYGSGSESHSYSSRSYDREERSTRHVKKRSHSDDEEVVQRKKPKHDDDDDGKTKKAAAKSDDKEPVNKSAEKTAPKTEDKSDEGVTKKAEVENSSITATARTDTAEVTGTTTAKATATETPASTGEGCRRFVAAVGAVINVPCD